MNLLAALPRIVGAKLHFCDPCTSGRSACAFSSTRASVTWRCSRSALDSKLERL